jgi:hypothetical protein
MKHIFQTALVLLFSIVFLISCDNGGEEDPVKTVAPPTVNVVVGTITPGQPIPLTIRDQSLFR